MINHIVEEDLKYIISSDLHWNKFKDKTILISGASGLIGSYLLYTFIFLNEYKNMNCKIICIVRNKEKFCDKFMEYINKGYIELIVQNVSEPLEIDKKIHYIIHAASQASPKFYKVDPVGTIDANVIGTRNLLELAKKNNVLGFLFFSSSEVYGEVGEKIHSISENDYGYLDPIEVRSCYAESKRLGENMCVSWANQYNVQCKIVRPFHTYGPGIRFDDGRVFSDFVNNVVNGQDIIIKSTGEAKRAFCYLADAILGFIMVLLNGKIGEAYNVGNEECEISIKDLAYTLRDLFEDKHIDVIINESKCDKNYLKSPVKSALPETFKIRALGWKPRYGIKEGFRRTILSYF